MDDRQAELLKIAATFPEEASSLSGFLRAVQHRFNWLPPEALDLACDHFNVSYPFVYEEASLSPDLCTEERGRLVIQVCRGLACSEAHSKDVFKDWEGLLGLKDGETSVNKEYTLCTQNCFGRCAIGPNLRVNDKFYSGQEPGGAKAILEAL